MYPPIPNLLIIACLLLSNNIAFKSSYATRITLLPNATAFYVDGATGNDGNPGSEAAPFKTIAKANAAAVDGAGTQIYVRSGVVYAEPLIAEGVNKNNVTYLAWNKTVDDPLRLPPVIDTENRDSGFFIKSGHEITIDGFFLRDPGYKWGWIEDSHHITIRNCFFDQDPARYVKDDPFSALDLVESSHHITLQGNHFNRWGLPIQPNGDEGTGDMIWIKGLPKNRGTPSDENPGTHHVLIDSNFFDGFDPANPKAQSQWGKGANSGHNLMFVGGRWNVIRNNRFYNRSQKNVDAIGYLDRRPAEELNGFHDGTHLLFEGNLFIGGTTTTNPAGGGGLGLSLAASNSIVRFNIFDRNQRNGLQVAAWGDESSDFLVPDIANNHIYHNTFYHNGYVPDSLDKINEDAITVYDLRAKTISPKQSHNNEFRNNLFYDNSGGVSDDGWVQEGMTQMQFRLRNEDNTFGVNQNFIISNLFFRATGAANNEILVHAGEENAQGFAAFRYPLQADAWNDEDTTLLGNEWLFRANLVADPHLDIHTFTPGTGSAALGAAWALAYSLQSGTNSTTLPVNDAQWFSDGFDDLVDADWLRLGTEASSPTVRIASIDYINHVITLATPATWAEGTQIYLASRSDGSQTLFAGGPDIGAIQRAAPIGDGEAGKWTSTNPGGGGAFAAIGAGPTGIVLAASDLSGVFRSRDRGKTWDDIGARHGLLQTHAGSVGFDPQDGNLLYIGTEAGIYRSNNGGDSVYSVLDHGYISEIRFAPSDPQIGYAGYHPAWDSDQGVVYKSSDRGQSWSQISLDLPAKIRILKLIVHPTDPGTLYLLSGKARFAQAPKNVYKSSDGGVHWQQIGTDRGEVMDIALDTTDPNVLYLTSYVPVMEGEYETYSEGAFHRSSDGGASWTKLADRTGTIWVDRDDQHAIRLIQVDHQWPWDAQSNGVWESTDGGAKWTKISKVDDWGTGWVQAYWSYAASFDGAVKSLGDDLSDPDALWWTNTQWVHATFDDGRSFAHQHTKEITTGHWQSTGFDNVVAFDLAISPLDSQLYAGYYDIGCWRSDDAAASWQICNDPAHSWSEGKGGNMITVATDPTRSGVLWASQSVDIDKPNTLLRSGDGGQSWQLANDGLSGAMLSGLSVDATSSADRRTLFVTSGGDLYQSKDDGLTWSLRLDCNGCRQSAVDAFDGKWVYAGGEAGLWRSATGGATGSWQQIGPAEFVGTMGDGFWSSDWEGVTAIVPDAHHAGWLYVVAFGAGRGLYRSKDGGDSWEKLWTNDFARNVAISPVDGQMIFVTSSSSVNRGVYNSGSMGVMLSRDGGASWKQVNDGLEWPFANNVLFDPHNPDIVYIDSAGTGVQKRTFAAENPDAGNLVKNGDFDSDADFWTIWGNGLSAQANGGELCLHFEQELANIWDAGIDQSGIALEQGKQYRLRMKLWSQRAATIKLIVGESQEPWTNYWNQLVALPADNLQIYNYDFTMNDLSDTDSGLFFHVGGHSSPVICVDEIELSEVNGTGGEEKVYLPTVVR